MPRRKKAEYKATVLIVIRKGNLDDSLAKHVGSKKKKDRYIELTPKCHQLGIHLKYGVKSLEISCQECGRDMFTALVSEQPKLLVCSEHPQAGVRLSYNGTHLKTECRVCKKDLNSICPQE